MAEVISKNARTAGSKTLKFECECSGEVKAISVFSKGKLKTIARCEKCGTEKRSPKDFKMLSINPSIIGTIFFINSCFI